MAFTEFDRIIAEDALEDSWRLSDRKNLYIRELRLSLVLSTMSSESWRKSFEFNRLIEETVEAPLDARLTCRR